MKKISDTLRQQDIKKLTNLIYPTNGHIENWIVQGMPHNGVETVFNAVVNQVEQNALEKDKTFFFVSVDFSQYWMSHVNTIIKDVFFQIPVRQEVAFENDLSLSDAIGCLKRKITTSNSEGVKLVFILKNFDSVLKFQSKQDIQHLLNMFQTVCSSTSYKTVNIIQCYRDVEDICQSTNFSDYYKIFGTNHFRVTNLEKEQIKNTISDLAPDLPEEQITTLSQVSGGFPELADVALRFVQEDILLLEKYCLDALDLIFQEWDKVLSPEEKAAINFIVSNSIIIPEHRFGVKKLIRKGLALEKDGKVSITSPLYLLYLTNKTAPKTNIRKVFIRNFSNLLPVHRDLLDELFTNRYYLEWKYLQQPTSDNATVYYIFGEDKDGSPYRPCIVKIDKSDRSASETKNLDKAIKLLGNSLVPGITQKANKSGYEALVMEYASSDNRTNITKQFADYYQEKTSLEVSNLLERVLGQALYPLYRDQEVKQRSLRKLYYLPILDRGEVDQINKIVQRSRYYEATSDQIYITDFGRRLPNPANLLRPSADGNDISDYHKLFVNNYPFGLCLSHGDLNPRNFLVDGIDNIHLIDFTEMRPDSPRFKDFTRIETEIKFKLVNITKENFKSILALEFMHLQSKTFDELRQIGSLSLDTNSLKLLNAIRTIRQQSRKICFESINDHEFYREYMLGLLAQTLRIALFKEYINELQQEFAVLSAAFISEKLLEEIA